MSDKDLKQSRSTREVENRKFEERDQVWKPPAALDSSIDPPPGKTFRWIRSDILGQPDKTNISKRFNEGFKPVTAESFPNGHGLPVVDEGRHSGVIGVGGLILCEIDNKILEQRRNYYKNMTDNQMRAIENDLMREENPAMPITRELKTRVTFGKE